MCMIEMLNVLTTTIRIKNRLNHGHGRQKMKNINQNLDMEHVNSQELFTKMSHKISLTGHNMMNRDNLSRHHATYHHDRLTSHCLQMLVINQNYLTNHHKPHKSHRKQVNNLDNQLLNNQELRLLNSQ